MTIVVAVPRKQYGHERNESAGVKRFDIKNKTSYTRSQYGLMLTSLNNDICMLFEWYVLVTVIIIVGGPIGQRFMGEMLLVKSVIAKLFFSADPSFNQ